MASAVVAGTYVEANGVIQARLRQTGVNILAIVPVKSDRALANEFVGCRVAADSAVEARRVDAGVILRATHAAPTGLAVASIQ